MKEQLDELVRRVDQDRWLSSRFAPAPVRKRLIALYAFNYELAHVGESASDPLLGAMRLQFWADAIKALYAGEAAHSHPALPALGEAMSAADLPRSTFEAMIEARKLDLETAPFENWNDLEAYLCATAGGVFDLACRICAPDRPIDAGRQNLVRACALAWGYIGLVRAFEHWKARRRTFLPKRVRDHVGLDQDAMFSGATPDHAAMSALREVINRASGALRDVRRFSPSAGKDLFPAIGYVALVSDYAREAASAPTRMREMFSTSLMGRQIKLVGAAATGSI